MSSIEAGLNLAENVFASAMIGGRAAAITRPCFVRTRATYVTEA
jgi:hypothetical protein